MKKLVKVLVVFLAFFSQLPLVSAQDAAAPTYVELMQKANEANQKLETFHLDSTLTASLVTKKEPQNLTFSVEGDIDVKNLEFQTDVNLQVPQSQDVNLEAVLKGGTLFYRQVLDEWNTTDVAMAKQRYQQEFAKALAAAESDSELSKEFNEAVAELFDVEVDDDEYKVSLKQDVDGEKFYNDHAELFAKLQDEAVKQAQAAGQKVDPASLSRVFTAENFKKFFELKPVVEATYDKETYFLKTFTIVVHADVEQVAPEAAEGDNGLVTADLTFSLTLSNHNQPVDIQAPEADSSMSSSSSAE